MFRCTLMTQEEEAAWKNAYDILEQYSSEGDLLVSMLLSNYCLENNIATSNYEAEILLSEYDSLHLTETLPTANIPMYK